MHLIGGFYMNWMKKKTKTIIKFVLWKWWKLIYISSWRKNKEQILRELMEYTNLSRNEISINVEHGAELVADEWNKLNPQTLEEIIKAYQELENYIYDLSNYDYFNIPEFIYRERSAKISRRSKRFLDYGAGIGDICLRVKQINNNVDVTYYDLKGKTMDFAKWRFKKRRMNINIIEASDNEDMLQNKYDTIICFDILEHVMDPEKHLKRIQKHLEHNGQLFIKAPFEKSQTHSMHIDSEKTLVEYLTSLNFKKKGRSDRLVFPRRWTLSNNSKLEEK